MRDATALWVGSSCRLALAKRITFYEQSSGHSIFERSAGGVMASAGGEAVVAQRDVPEALRLCLARIF